MINLLSNNDAVPVNASITAGGFVAEIDNANVRKNTLRLGS